MVRLVPCVRTVASWERSSGADAGAGWVREGRGRRRRAVTVAHAFALLCAAGILIVWIVYPALIGCLAARRRRRMPHGGASVPPPRLPSVSIVIATRDDPDIVCARIADCISGAHDSPPLEVIVAVDRLSKHLVPSDRFTGANVRIVAGDHPGGKAATLNAAVRSAQHELVLFTDAHQRFEPNAVARLAAAFADDRVGAASGRLELSTGARQSPVGRYWSFERWLRRCEATINSCVGATGAIWAVRRSLWSPLPTSLILDDVFTPMRVVLGGRRVVFVDDARATDLRNPEPAQEYRRKVRTLTGVVQLCCWLPELLLPSRNPIWFQFMFHKLLRLLTPYWVIGLATWCGLMLVRLLETKPVMMSLPLATLAAVSAVPKSKIARIIGSAVVWGVTLQAALLMATVNGIRRHWDVWNS